MSTTNIDLQQKLFAIAKEYSEKGPGYAQESVVLRELKLREGIRDLSDQQRVLDLWYKLFSEGKLVWGYDFDNPGSPFFHLPE